MDETAPWRSSSVPRAGGRVTMQQVAAEAGVSVSTVSKVINGRYGVSSRDLRPRQRGDRPARLRGQPGGAQPAQHPHQRDRPAGRGLRAVQHRGAQGRGGRDPRHRLRAGRLLRRRPRRRARRLGAALPVAGDGHARRRRGAGDPDRDRRAVRRPDRRGRPAHRPVAACRRSPPTTCRAPGWASTTCSASGTAASAWSPAAPTWSRRSCASRATARRTPRPAYRSTRRCCAAARSTPSRRGRPPATLLRLPEPPTAIFAANDISALATLEVAAELGVDVPGRLSVVGLRQHPRVGARAPAADDRRSSRCGRSATTRSRCSSR